MKAVVRVLIAVLSLLVVAAVIAPAVSAAPAIRSVAAATAVSPAVPGTVVMVPPKRVVDSRVGLQILGPVGAFSTAVVRVKGGAGIPDSGVVSVIATLTVVRPQASGHIRICAAETNCPSTSALNFSAGQTTSNMVLMSSGLENGVELFNGSGGAVHLVVDVTGYIPYIPQQPSTAAGAAVPVFPTRIADSRVDQQISGPVGAAKTVGVQVGGRGGVPSAGVAAVIATIAVVTPQRSGYLTAWKADTARPPTSNLNFQAHHTIANTMVLPLSKAGKIQVFNGSSGAVHIIVDVSAYIRAGTPTTAGTVATVTPARVADSRVGWQIPGVVPAASTVPVKVTGIGGIPANGASAVVLTMTVVAPQAAGYFKVWQTGAPWPGTSNLNFAARQTVATTVIAQVGPDGQIQVRNGSPGAVHMAVDVTGYTLSTSTVAGGAAWAWGNAKCDQAGRCGALGNGGTADSARPVPVAGPNNVKAVAGGSAGGYALHGDGTVWAWGSGYLGQLGNGGTADSKLPVQVSGLNSVKAIASGSSTGYALRNDGTVWAWGYGGMGRLGNGRTADSTRPVPVSGLSGVTAVAANLATGYAVSDGKVWAWGWGQFGQLGNGRTADSAVPVQVPGLTSVTAITAGGHNGYALRSDGTVWAWGPGFSGQLGNDGTTASLVPVQVSGLTTVKLVASGHRATYAVRSDGTVWAWGDNFQGSLGNGSTTRSLVPVRVSGLTTVTAVAGGNSNGYAVRGDGTLWAWGSGLSGQLGNGSTADSAVPVRVAGLTQVSAISAGDGTAFAVTR
ncbi:RCC1 domain-containing protein [Nakamurella sp. GG22]